MKYLNDNVAFVRQGICLRIVGKNGRPQGPRNGIIPGFQPIRRKSCRE